MSQDRMQLQRLELKYRISHEIALGVRDFVASYLEVDEFGATRPNLSYPVHSLYLDSPRLTTFEDTINGNKNRFKLRVRFYENRPNAPVYFEIKRRMNEAILKQRAAVRREAVDRVLAGQFPSPDELASTDPRHIGGMHRFLELSCELRARPVGHVAYLREAWMSARDNSVRVTMDRDVRFEPDTTSRLDTAMQDPVLVFGKQVVLELKFTGRFPDWWRDLVRVFDLERSSAAKYVDGITRYGEERVRDALRWAAPPTPPVDTLTTPSADTNAAASTDRIVPPIRL